MKTKNIEELIDLLENRNLSKISYKDKDLEIQVERQVQSSNGVVAETAVSTPTPLHAKNTIVSPLVGVYYSKPSPEDQPFVVVGQSIAVGDVICIIEAMKVMSEIKSDKAGIVSEILLDDGSPIAYDQAILVLK